MKKKIMSLLLAILMVIGLIPDVSLTAYAEDPYASIKNTTTVVHFDGKDWYLIDYDNTTVTLLTKDSVGTSTFGSNNKYDESTVKTFVNNWYNENISAAKKEAVSGNGMFLLNSQQVNNIPENVRKCNTSTGSWWTRSGGTNNMVVAVNGNTGDFDDYDGDYLCSHTLDVRPALKLNLEKVDFIAESKRFKLKEEGHYVAITPGNNMTKTSDSGDETQNDISEAIIDVVYNANEGYYFPEDYSIAEVNGVNVTRDSYTQITVSGKPTNDALITLTDPTAKTTPAAPTTAVSINCTNLDNNDGKLTGVTTEMEYKKSNDTDWTPGTGNDITGLESGTYYVRLKETDTTLPSENQELTIKKFVEYTVIFEVVNGSWNDETDAAKTVTVEGYEGEEIRLRTSDIPAVGSKPNTGYKVGSWDIEPTNTTTITQDTTYTYTYASKGGQTISVENVSVTYGDTDKKVEASVSDPTTGGGAISYAVKEGSEDYIDVDAANGTLTIKKVPTDAKAYVIVTAAGNYDYFEAIKEVTVTIAKKEVTVSGITAEDKVYDGNTDVTLNYDDVGINGIVDGDDLSVSSTGTFEDEKAGTDKKVTISDLALTGDSASNYKLAADGQQTETKATITHKYEKVAEVPATCTEAGKKQHWKDEEGTIYKDAEGKEAVTEADLVIDAFNHDWNTPTYDWAIDKSTVTATRVCKNDSTHSETETVNTTSTVTKQATLDEEGTVTYSATFTNPAFVTQTKEKSVKISVEPTNIELVVDEGYKGEVDGGLDEDSIKQDIVVTNTGSEEITFILGGFKDSSSYNNFGLIVGGMEATLYPRDGLAPGTYSATVIIEDYYDRFAPIEIPVSFTVNEVIVYSNTQGNNQDWYKGSTSTADFTFKRSKDDSTTINHFTSIKVDGKDVDNANYVAESGSVIVKLKPAYLETLSDGEHTLTAYFDDGKDATTKFNILAKENPKPITPSRSVPNTAAK